MWWKSRPLPTVGGGQPPGITARWIVQRAYSEVSPDDEAGFQRLDLDHPSGWLSVFREEPQTLSIYQAQKPIRPTTQRRLLVIQPLGPMNSDERQLVQTMREYSEAFFQLPTRVAPAMTLQLVESQARHNGPTNRVGGKQFMAGSIFEDILRPSLPDDAIAYFGITAVDLYAPGLNFVFGQGSFTERVGVYSLARYVPEFWGRTRGAGDDKLALRRACQVLTHEAGHVFGLRHCVFYRCSMNGSNSLSESDTIPLEPCPICLSKLQWNIGFDPTKRLHALRDFYARHKLDSEAHIIKRLQHGESAVMRSTRIS
jgi:archaemetzincin